jgi:hypothetical protein
MPAGQNCGGCSNGARKEREFRPLLRKAWRLVIPGRIAGTSKRHSRWMKNPGVPRNIGGFGAGDFAPLRFVARGAKKVVLGLLHQAARSGACRSAEEADRRGRAVRTTRADLSIASMRLCQFRSIGVADGCGRAKTRSHRGSGGSGLVLAVFSATELTRPHNVSKLCWAKAHII